MLKRLSLLTGLVAVAVAVALPAAPALSAGKSHKCAVHDVAYIAHGKFVSWTAMKTTDHRYSGMLTVHVTSANHRAANTKNGDVTYTLANTKVTRGSGANPPKAGDSVTVTGTITVVSGTKCSNKSAGGVVTANHVDITKPPKK